MHDDQLRSLLRALDTDEQPTPEFADALFNLLSRKAGERPGSRGLVLLLAAALLVATIAASAAVGSGVVKWPWTSERSPVVVAETSPSPQPSASGPATVAPSPSPRVLQLTTLVVTTVDGVRVRAAPGTNAEVRGPLAAGSVALVVEGPRIVDGLAWYLLSAPGLVNNTGCISPPPGQLSCQWMGWAAAAAADGSPWMEPTAVPGGCPARPTVTQLGAMLPAYRLVCYANREITFRGYYPTVPPGGELGGQCEASALPIGWLACLGTNNYYLGLPGDGAGAVTYFSGPMRFNVDPASGITVPQRGQWLEVTGHFDDPAAADCGPAFKEPGPEFNIVACRWEFVLTGVTVVPGP